MRFEVRQFICLEDNFAVLVHDPTSGRTLAVDAPDGALIEKALNDAGWNLDLILVTHHHGDHTGGIEALKRRYRCAVMAPRGERNRIPGNPAPVGEGAEIDWADQKIRVIDTPGHSPGHVSYHLPFLDAVFVGDTLFALGCGRVPEGSHETMWRSISKLAALPPQTRMYCGHDYAEQNSRFALTIEPDNQALQRRVRALRGQPDGGALTRVSTIGEELEANPFLRSGQPSVKAAVGMTNAPDSAVFAELRRRKDKF